MHPAQEGVFHEAAAGEGGLPGGGAEMVALESPREISGDGGVPTETQRSKRALP